MFFSKSLHLFRVSRFIKKFLFFVFAVAVFGTNSYAEVFNCQYLYGAKIETKAKTNRIVKYTNIASNLANTNTDVLFSGVSGDDISTIALGRVRNAGGMTDELRLYRWKYAYWTTDNNASDERPSYFKHGDTSTRHFVNYNPSGLPKNKEAAGGEVNQMTGDIYMTSNWSDKISDGNFYMMVIDPYTGATRHLAPTAADSSQPSLGMVISDMIVDAEGNVFVVASAANNAQTMYLTRINMTTGKYSVIKGITDTNTQKIGAGSGSLGFLNGYIYVQSGGEYHKIDPVTGIATYLGSGDSVEDFASCQVVPVITGKIYNDANGDGVISSAEKSANNMPGVTVELYDGSGKVIGEQVTKDSGEFSFIIGDFTATYYVRVKNPKINGINAAQTWALGGQFTFSGAISGGINTVTNYCTDFNSDDTSGSTSNRTCYGARKDGKDSLTSSLSGANYYSKIEMTTDKAVPHIEFAFSIASDRSDAEQPEVLHNLAIKGPGGDYRAYLGSNVTVDSSSIKSPLADSDIGDDGLYVLINGRYMPVQQRGFVKNATYQFRADINGTLKNSAKLNIWLPGHISTGELTEVTPRLVNPLSNTTSGADSIFFTATIPDDAGGYGIDRTLRARFSTSEGINAVNNVSTNLNNDPWVIDGEVEDYKVSLLSRQVRISLKTVGTSGNSGDFTFQMGNMLNNGFSYNSTTFSTNAPDVITDEPLGAIHEINASNTAVPITIDKPQIFSVIQSQTNCIDINNGNANVPLDFSIYQGGSKWYDSVTIPSASVKDNSDIVCLFTYGTAPMITINANVTNRAFANDNFNLTLSDINASSVITSNITTTGTNTTSVSAILAADHTNNISISMLTGSTGTLDRYAITPECKLSSGSSIPTTVTDGWFTVKAAVADNITCSVTLTASTISAINSKIEVIPQDNDAGNISLVLITLKDTNNITLPSGGDSINLFISSPVIMELSNGVDSIYSPTTSNITAIDNNNGTYTAYITSNLTGEANLTFSVNAVAADDYAVAKFNHLSVDMDNSNTSITITPPSSVEVDNNVTALIRVVDKFGNGVTNATIALRVIANTTSGTPTLYNTDVLNHHNGTYEINLTSAKQGDVTVSFSVDNINANNNKNATATFTATNGNASSPYSNITITPSSLVVSNAALITVYLSDDAGHNGIAGQDVRLVFADNKQNNATIYPNNTTYQMNDNATLGSGYYTAWINSTIADTYTLSFKVGQSGSQSIHNASIRYNPADVDLGASDTSYMTVESPKTVNELSKITVRLADSYNNTITDKNVTIFVVSNDTLGTPSITPITIKGSNDISGNYVSNLNSSKAGNITLNFDVEGVGNNTAKSKTVEYKADSYNITGAYTYIKASPSITNAGNTSLITVYLADNDNNSIDAENVNIVITSANAANATIAPTPANKLGNGIYTANITSTVEGNYTITFNVNGGSNSAKNTWVYFTPDSVDLDSSYSYITSPLTTQIDDNATVRVYLLDKFDNAIKNATVDIRVIAGDTGNFAPINSNNAISFTTDASDTKGGYYQALYTTPKAGNVTFGFSANSIQAPNTNNATTNFTSTGPTIQSGYTKFSVTPKDNNVSDYVALNLYLADNNSNPQSGYKVTFHVKSRTFENGTTVANGNEVYIGAVTDHNNGTYTTQASTNTSANVTFYFVVDTIGDSSSSKTDWANFKSGSVDIGSPNTTITATPSTQIDTNSTVVVTLRDKDNNPINNESVKVKVLSGDSGTFYPSSATVTQNGSSNGEYVVYFTTPKAGSVTFGFEVGGKTDSSKNATTLFTSTGANITGAHTKFTTTPKDNTVGDNITLDLSLADNNGNYLDGYKVSFYVNSQKLANGTILSNGNGIYISNVVDTGNGTYTAQASTNTSANVTFYFVVDTVGNSSSSKTDWANFKSGSVDIGNPNTTITATPTTEVNTNSTITVTLRDKDNNPVNNESVKVKVLSGNSGTFYPSSAVVSQDGTNTGKYIAHFTTKAAQNVTFGFEVSSRSDSSKNASTIFTSGSFNSASSDIRFTPSVNYISVEENFNITASIKDKDSNPIAQTIVTFSVDGNTKVANSSLNSSSVTCITNTKGECSVIWTSDKAG
ncbi:MAG: hypothetical protein LBQ18_06195, partial [Campylobacteraceae bacterium]|nr:hypothetical protein [Campylobacteraceae bacterium]